jgi:hypothetical protein
VRPLLLPAAGLLVLGLGLGAWFGKRVWDRQRLAAVAASGEPVAAQVIDLRAIDRKGTRWAITYRFSSKGRFYERTVRDVPAATRERVALGSVLQVRYDPGAPERSICTAESAPPPSAGDWAAAVVPPAVALVLLAAALLRRRGPTAEGTEPPARPGPN